MSLLADVRARTGVDELLDACLAVADHFWERVERQGSCWRLPGESAGYGTVHLRLNGHRVCVHAHRFSWIVTRGPIPKGYNVLHKCDVRPCVRPADLFLGTQSENIYDAYKKGRMSLHRAMGEAHGQSKLTRADVRSIRAMHCSGMTGRAIAAQLGVSANTISQILRGRSWAWLNEVDGMGPVGTQPISVGPA